MTETAIHNRVTQMTGTAYPIIQAPMGWIARAQLASAVSNAGGMGIYGVARDLPEEGVGTHLAVENFGMAEEIEHFRVFGREGGVEEPLVGKDEIVGCDGHPIRPFPLGLKMERPLGEIVVVSPFDRRPGERDAVLRVNRRVGAWLLGTFGVEARQPARRRGR